MPLCFPLLPSWKKAGLADDVRKKALLFLFLALIATILIGAGLPRLKLQPGMPLPSLGEGQVTAPATVEVPLVQVQVSQVLKILLGLILAGILIYLVYRGMAGTSWKDLLSGLLKSFAVALVVFVILFLAISLLPKSELVALPETPPPTPTPVTRVPLGPAPTSLLWIVGLFLAIAAVFLGLSLVRMKAANPRANQLELEVESARQALLSGLDFKDVILQCYQRMSLALQQEQQIERESFMTTGEFQRLLLDKGLPPDPVRRLTRLFEAVRYGHWQPNPDDEQNALQALEAILQYSHERRQAS